MIDHDLAEAQRYYYEAGGTPSDIGERGIGWYQRRTVRMLRAKLTRLENHIRLSLHAEDARDYAAESIALARKLGLGEDA